MSNEDFFGGEELFETQLARLRKTVEDLRTLIEGEKKLRLVGLVDKIDLIKNEILLEISKINQRITHIETTNSKWKYILWGIGFGAGITVALIFGLTLKEIKAFIK